MSNELTFKTMETTGRDIAQSFIRAGLGPDLIQSAIDELSALHDRMMMTQSIEAIAVAAAINVLKSCDIIPKNATSNDICKNLLSLKMVIEASMLPSACNLVYSADEMKLHAALLDETTVIVTCARLNTELFDLQWKSSQSTPSANFSFNINKEAILQVFSLKVLCAELEASARTTFPVPRQLGSR